MRNPLTRRVTAAMFALAFVTASATTASAAPGLNQNVENEAAASAADNSKTSSTTTLSSGESMSISEEDWSELSTDADEGAWPPNSGHWVLRLSGLSEGRHEVGLVVKG